jgi:hypothetical protein
MRNNPVNRKTKNTRKAALAILASALAFVALIGCSSGGGDPPPAQPSVSIADFIGYWEEDSEGSLFNLTIEAGETPGTVAFLSPIDRAEGELSLSGGAATLNARAEAAYDDTEQTITVNPDSPVWKTVYSKYSGGNESIEGFWVAEVMGNEHGLSIEFDSGSYTSGTFEYLVQGMAQPLYTGTFTCEYDGDDADIEIAFNYGTASLNAAKDVMTLTRVFDPEEPLELLKTTQAIPSLADFAADWVYNDSVSVRQHYVGIGDTGEITYTIFDNSNGSIISSRSGNLVVDALGAGLATSSMSVAYEYDSSENNVFASIPGVSGNVFEKSSGGPGTVVGTWRKEMDDESYIYLTFSSDGTMSYTDRSGFVMTGTYTGSTAGSFTASGDLATITIDMTMNPRIIYFTPSGGSAMILEEQLY